MLCLNINFSGIFPPSLSLKLSSIFHLRNSNLSPACLILRLSILPVFLLSVCLCVLYYVTKRYSLSVILSVMWYSIYLHACVSVLFLRLVLSFFPISVRPSVCLYVIMCSFLMQRIYGIITFLSRLQNAHQVAGQSVDL